MRLADDEEVALAQERAELAQRIALVVEEQDREWERKRGRVGDADEPALRLALDPAGRIRQRRVCDEGEAEVAEGEEDRERERVVAVPELPEE